MRQLAVISMLALVGCGTSDPQSQCQASCLGCCRAGVCLDGRTLNACGANGFTCVTCMATDTCNEQGACEHGGAGGGEASGGGQGGGAPSAGGGTAATGGGDGIGGGGSTCQPETDSELCQAAHRPCGSLSVAWVSGMPAATVATTTTRSFTPLWVAAPTANEVLLGGGVIYRVMH